MPISVVLASCGGDNPEPNYADSVTTACENKDFVKAYAFAEKAGNKKEVIKKEVFYVLENQREAGLVRIAMIVNEHNASWVYLDALKMAIAMGDEALAKKIYNMTDASDEQTLNYAITAGMKSLIHSILDKHPDYIEKQNLIDYLKEE